MSEKLVICETGCTNKMNTTGDCEEFLSKYLNTNDIFLRIEDYYNNMCRDFGLNGIQSTTIINGTSAQVYFFKDVVELFFGCTQLKNSILSLNSEIYGNCLPEILKTSVQSKVRFLLYGNGRLLNKAIEIGDLFYEKFGTDLFINILVSVDSTYKCSHLS